MDEAIRRISWEIRLHDDGCWTTEIVTFHILNKDNWYNWEDYSFINRFYSGHKIYLHATAIIMAFIYAALVFIYRLIKFEHIEFHIIW